MLDRDGRGGLGRRLSSANRMVWYGGGSVLVVGLVGLLVWLARGSTEQQQVDAIALAAPVETVGAHKAEPAPASVHPAAAIVEEPQPAAQESRPPAAVSPPSEMRMAEASDTGGATVVQDDAAAARGIALVENDPLAAPSEQAAPQEVRPSAHMGTAHEMIDTTPAHLAAAHDEAKTAAPKPMPAAAFVKLAQVQHTPKSAHGERARSHAGAKATAAHASRHNAARATRKHKPQPVQQVAAAPVDSDVALISAVIRHANNSDPAAPGCDCSENTTPKP